MELIFATSNRHKQLEVGAMMPSGISLSIPVDHGIVEEIPEDELTLEGNARAKSMYVWERLGVDCFADDTGLEVLALGGAPGVYSARFAGVGCSFEDNIELLLSRMEGVDDRRARFRTVISLIMGGVEHQFEGEIWGHITPSRMEGLEGFGYDPVFVPDGYDESFAQMPLELKNRISHRGLATAKLLEFLRRRI